MARIIFDEDKNKLVAEIYHTGYKDGVAAAKPSVKETCEDAVSRQSVKEQMIYYGFLAPDMTVTEFVEDCLPSVNPQKIGHWFAWKPEDDVWRTTCSECGEETRTLWDYCPHCGAKMVEPKESEE